MDASLTLPASQAGEGYEFEQGLKANLPEILASIRVLRRNTNLITSQKGKAGVTSPELLRKTFNMKFGLEESGSDPWVSSILKACFSEVTKPTAERFPGEWMHSLRIRNNTKSDIGIIAKMGYKPVQVAPIKVQKVLMSKRTLVRETQLPTGKKGNVIIGQGSIIEKEVIKPLTFENFPEGTNFREFRAAVTMLLPYIDPNSPKGLKDQLISDPLHPVSEFSLKFWKEHGDVADAFNTAFAILAACSDKKSKTTPTHQEMSRNYAISKTANVGFYDKFGRRYPTYLSIPEHIRSGFEKSFCRKISDAEEVSDDDTSSDHKKGDVRQEDVSPLTIE